MDTIDRFDDVVELAWRRAPLYVRFSAGPEADADHTSLDFEAGVELPGLSVCSLTPEPWWTRLDDDWVARRLCKYLDLQEQSPERRPWLLTGRVVGSGTDHEPLIDPAEPVGWVSDAVVDEAKAIYRSRFIPVKAPVTGDRESG